MSSPGRRKILNFKILKNKFRQLIKYLSAFLFALSSLLFISSTNPEISGIDDSYSPPEIKDTIYVYDTVIYYDTTYVYDTLYKYEVLRDTVKIITKFPLFSNIKYPDSVEYTYFDKGELPFPSNRYLFSGDIFFSPFYSKHSFKSDILYDEVLNLNKNSVKPSLSNILGLGINFHRRSIILSSGILFTTIRENYNFLATDYLIDTVMSYKFFTTTYTEVDTIEFYNIDSLLIGDTVIEYYFDTTFISLLDSSLVPKLDTLENKFNDKSENSYRYIEIPLIFSFTIYRPNFSISPEIGIITSFFVNSKGKIVSLANHNQSNSLDDESKFALVNISLYTGLKLTYIINNKFDFFTTAFYRKNINSIFSDYPIISGFNNFGFNFGLRYKLRL